jgi:hypothetical protein
MIAMALLLLAMAEGTVNVSAVRIEAEGDGLVLRVALSGPVTARVEREGRDLVVVLPGASPAPGLVLPEAVAEIQSLAVEPSEPGTRIRIRLEKPLAYEMTQEDGLVSLSIRNTLASTAVASALPSPAPSPSPRPPAPGRDPESIRELYAKILPPPFGVGTDGTVPGAGDRPNEPRPEAEGLHFGPVRVLPSLLTSYIDADSALLDTAEPVRDRYFQIEPRLLVDVGEASLGATRFQLAYTPRFRLNSAFGEVRQPSHIATASLDAPIGTAIILRASHHYAHGVLETTEVDPGREYFFQLSPFTRNQTVVGALLNAGGRLGLDLSGSRDAVTLEDDGAFFDHRTDSVAASVTYQVGAISRVYGRYTWSHVPTPDERPLAESNSSTVSAGITGDILPLVTGDLEVGYRSLSAPRAGEGGTRFRGTTVAASLRKEFTPSTILALVARRDTYPSDFETNAFYVATGFGAETDLALPLSLAFHGAVGWQRNAYQVVATGLSVPRQDEIVGWSAGLGRSLTRWSFLRADYRQDHRTSNVPDFDTDGHSFVIQLGLGYLGNAAAGAAPR